MLHQLRAATDNYGNGELSKLSCTATSSAQGTPLSGTVGPASGAAANQNLSYQVYVRYYDDRPQHDGDF